MTIGDKYEGKHCEVCGTPIDITRDHIIPKWLERRFAYFQLEVFIVNNDQYLCKAHNYAKGGIIDYEDVRVRKFLRKFISMLEEKLRQVEEKIRVEKFQKTMETKRLKDIELKKKETPVVNLFEGREIVEDPKAKGRKRHENKAKDKEDVSGIKF